MCNGGDWFGRSAVELVHVSNSKTNKLCTCARIVSSRADIHKICGHNTFSLNYPDSRENAERARARGEE